MLFPYSILHVIKCCIPDSCKDDSNEKEDKPCHKNIAIIAFLGIAQLACTVIGIYLVFCPTHRDKGKDNISEDEADADEGALSADIHHARKQRHQYAGDKECVG